MVSGQNNREHAMVEVAIQTDNNEQVRDFQKISIKDVNNNLVIWSSNFGKLERDALGCMLIGGQQQIEN